MIFSYLSRFLLASGNISRFCSIGCPRFEGMSNTKRWNVTYTKHLTQKRKVYQDGILELHGSNKKVMLYDDSEKLIDSRFLKKDEIVNLGGTLTLEAHLVEIGNLEGEKDVPLRSFHDSSAALNSNTKGRNLVHKGVLHSSGNLKHMLRNQLPNKESKSVDFGRRLPISSKSKEDIQNIRQKQENLNVMQSNIKEWDVLYTTQITQKSKRYHDGILRLSLCSSQMNQIVLLSEDGNVLSSKFLKYAECVKTGNKCDFPGYLVEICEPRSSTREEIQKAPTKLSTFSCSDNRNLQNPRGYLGNREKVHNQKNLSHNRQVSDEAMSCEHQQTDKPMRNACQIMFTLKKPVLEEQNHRYELTIDSANPSPSADFVSLKANDQKTAALNSPTTIYAPEILVDNKKDIFAKGPSQSFVQGAHDFKSKDSEDLLSSDITTSKDNYFKEVPIYQDCSSSNHLSGLYATPKLEVDFLNEETLTNKTSREEHKCLFPGSSSSNSRGNSLASGKKDVSENANSPISVSNDPDIADKLIGMISPGTSEVDELTYRTSLQTRKDNIKGEDICEPIQLLDEPMVTSNICKFSELQSSSGTSCLDMDDDVPTFDLGF